MLVSDLLHSCANERVAEAAVLSIGGKVAEAMSAESDQRGVSLGALTASKVRRFARDATERDWRDLVDGVRGHDFPVLAGLELILTRLPRRGLSERDGAQGARALVAAGLADGASFGGF